MKKYSDLHPLMISLDSAMLDGSYGNALERQLEYARHIGALTIVVLNTLNNQSKPLNSIKHTNLEIIPTNSKSRWHTVLDGYRIGSDLVQSQQSIPINLFTTQDAFISGFIGVILKKKLQLPLNVQIHASDLISPYWQNHSMQNKMLTYLSRWVLTQADTIRYGSNQSLLGLKSMVPSMTSKVFKAPVYVDAEYFEQAVSIKSGIKHLVTVGRVVKDKNHLHLIEAFAQLSLKYPDMDLTIAGGGPEENSLRRKINELQLKNRITITGHASKNQVKKYLHRADLFVFPSFYEGWGMAVVEAVAAGVPVVMTNVGCAGELIINGQTGVVFGDTSAEGIYKALSKAISHPKKLYLMAKAAQDTLKNNYQKETLITNFLECLNETAKCKN